MTMTATARRTGEGLRHRVDVNDRHLIATDEPVALGGTDTGPAPHELLPATLAACISTMIALYANRHGWALPDLRVEVVYDPDSTPRGMQVSVHLPPGLDDEQIARLRRVAETCPVRRALEAGFAIEERIDVGVPSVPST
jgi:putative redox protein